MNKEKLVIWVTLIAMFTLAITVLSMVFVFMIGFFDPQIENNKIFEIVGPAFQGVVGAMIGLVAGVKIGSSDND